MKILAQFPTFARPQKFLRCLGGYLNSTSGRHNIHFNINCDYDDKTMYNQEIVDQIANEFEIPFAISRPVIPIGF